MTSSSTSFAAGILPVATLAARSGPVPWFLSQRGPEAGRRMAKAIWPSLDDVPTPAADVLEPLQDTPGDPVPALSFGEEEVARLCAAAAAEAALATEARLEEGVRREQAALQSGLSAALVGLAEALQARRAWLQEEAVAIGAGLGRVLAYAALRQEPTAAAVAILEELLPGLSEEPEVTVEIPGAHAEDLRADLAAMAARAGFPGLIEVRPQPGLAPGEVRVAWRDGWAERLLAEIEARAAKALAGLTSGQAGQDNGTIEIVERAG